MKPAELFAAIRASWGKDTTDYPDEWDESSNHERGHCGMSALVVQDYLGGNILCCDVSIDGDEVGVHYTNRLPDNSLVDLTANQFGANEKLSDAYPIERRRLQPPKFRADRYGILRKRVSALVGPPDATEL